MGKTLLVTGVAGFIGSNFVYHYLSAHPERSIIGLDKITYAGNAGNLSAIPEVQRDRFTLVKGDIGDPVLVRDLFEKYGIDGVINFAAESHVDRSISDPQLFLRTNILGTAVLLDAARDAWGSKNRFLQVSTDEVYGSLGPSGRFTEETPPDPHSPYSASKAGADLIAKAYHDTYGMDVVITRCSNNFGPYQFPEKLIPLVISNALRHRDIPVYGDGRQVRDWLYVEDHCRAIDIVFESGRPGEVYNIGGNNERENIGIVKLILSTLREETGDVEIDERLIRYVKDRPGHDRRYAIDATKISRELGWVPEVQFSDGIRRTIRWYLENESWWRDPVPEDRAG